MCLALFLGAVAAPDAAWANCTGNFTYTYNGSGSSSYNLGNGQSLRIQSGTFSGNIDSLASTAKICIDSGATFSPNNLNNIAGQMINYGTIVFPNVNFGNGFSLDNFWKVTFSSSANFNGAGTFRNRANADLIFRQTVQFGNGSTFLNDGRVVADGNFNLQNNTVFTNNFEVLVRDTFNPDGVVNNYGRVHAERFININASSTATNHCSWIADEGFNNNSPRTVTLGLIFINWRGSGNGNNFQNNAQFKVGPNSITYGWSFMNNSAITNVDGTGGGRFMFKNPGVPPVQHTRNQGTFAGTSAGNPIIFYDDTRSSAAIFDSGNTPTNTIRQVMAAPPIDLASPTCSPAIRQVMTDPDPPAHTYDYSDAPASYGAPVHRIVAGLHLGARAPDWDGGPFATPNADGDDLSGNDDEDGVTMPTLQKGVQTALDVRVTGAGRLQAWIDYNGSGTFDTAEKIASNLQDTASGNGNVAGDGIIRIVFTPPTNATSNQTYLRLRWSSASNLNATAAANDGEVEDYAFTFGLAPPPTQTPGSGTTPSTCPAEGNELLVQPGNAVAQTSTGIPNAAQAIGAVSPNGAYASTANAATVGAGGVLTLDLTGAANQAVAAGGDITLSIARDDASARIRVQVSPNGTSWTTIGTYGAGGTLGNDFSNGVLRHVMFEAPAAGTRYIRIWNEAGTFFVDGAAFADICAPAGTPATLTVVKSSEPYIADAFLTPGADVSYAIRVTNSGDGAVDTGGILLVDTLPATLTFHNGAYAGPGGSSPYPFLFTQSGAALNFNHATDIAYSNAAAPPAAFAQCTYQPAAGYDAAVRHICIRPTGAMAGGESGTSFTVRFRARLN